MNTSDKLNRLDILNRSIYNIMWHKTTHPLKKDYLGDSDWAEIVCMLIMNSVMQIKHGLNL